MENLARLLNHDPRKLFRNITFNIGLELKHGHLQDKLQKHSIKFDDFFDQLIF